MIAAKNDATGRAVRTAWSTMAVAFGVLGLKTVAWWLTGSVALLADALESVVNVGASLGALVALILAGRPADANHPYGHSKAEYFSAVLEGVLIVLAALLILREAWFGFQAPRAPDAPALGLAVSAVASVVNGVWAWVLFRRGRALRSPALLADAKHLQADVITSAGVIVGVGLVALTGVLWLDPLLAALTALNILWSGGVLLRDSVGGLMDEAAEPELIERIRGLIASTAMGALEAHDLRTRHAGQVTFVEFHLVVPGEMRVTEAHDICDRIEAALRAAIPKVVVGIHVEPEGKAKHDHAPGGARPVSQFG